MTISIQSAAYTGSVDYGSDVSTFAGGNGLDPSFATITGPRVVAEALARRLMTPAGTMIGDPNYGYDLRALINKRLTVADLYSVRSSIAAELVKDERVQDVPTCDLTADTSTGVVTVTASVDLGQGPFALVLAVSAVTVQLLKVAS